MEENDDHGLNLSLTLKCLSPPHPPPSSTPPSQYHPSELHQNFPQKFTRVPYNLHTLLPPDHPLRHTPPIHNPYAEMDKEIEACMEEKRRRKAELKERVREHLRERAQRRQMEDEVAVVVSSPPNNTVSTVSLSGNKRKEREENNVEEEEKDLSSKYIVISEDEEDGGGDAAAEAAARKKLMMSKEQAAVLEETFKENNTLTNKEKVALAKQLDLRPRQVEVWFQNRRARTKLKQTEVDFGYLKTCCEVIGEENRHLKKELIELRALKHSYQSYVNMFPPTTLIMCSHCARVTTSSSSSSSTRTTCVTGAVNTNHQDLVSLSRPKSTSGIPFAKLISSEALDIRRPRP